MNPVNRPGTMLIRMISVRHSSRNNKKVIGWNFMHGFIQADFTFSFHAVNQDKLCASRKSFAKMVARLRIIANVRNVKFSEQQIVFDQSQNPFRNNKADLP